MFAIYKAFLIQNSKETSWNIFISKNKKNPRTDFGILLVYTLLNLQEFCVNLFVPFIYSFDIGPILLQKQYPVPDRVTALDLKTMMAERGSEVVSLVKIMNEFEIYHD